MKINWKQLFCIHDYYILETKSSLSWTVLEDKICTKCGKRVDEIYEEVKELDAYNKKQKERKIKAEKWFIKKDL